jgi:hypothetical protein
VGDGNSGRGEGDWRRLRWGYMVDELHIPTWNRAKKPLAIALRGDRTRVEGERQWGQCN